MDCGHIEYCLECGNDVCQDCMEKSRNCKHCGDCGICPNCIDNHENLCDRHTECDCFPEDDKDA